MPSIELPPEEPERVAVGDVAPDFTLRAHDGNTITLSERARSEHDQELDFPLLSDPGSRVIGRYGLLNPYGRGWPPPTVFLVDREGVVRWRFMEVDYRVRATNKDILAALAELRQPGDS